MPESWDEIKKLVWDFFDQNSAIYHSPDSGKRYREIIQDIFKAIEHFNSQRVSAGVDETEELSTLKDKIKDAVDAALNLASNHLSLADISLSRPVETLAAVTGIPSSRWSSLVSTCKQHFPGAALAPLLCVKCESPVEPQDVTIQEETQ